MSHLFPSLHRSGAKCLACEETMFASGLLVCANCLGDQCDLFEQLTNQENDSELKQYHNEEEINES